MKKRNKEDAISTFLGPESSITGTLSFEGTIRLDGKVEGKILSSDGTVIVGEQALIQAEIDVETAIIMGEVTGTIEARDRIEIYKPAKVTGDIQAPVISVDAGVTFNGNCAMRPKAISVTETKGESIQVVPSAAEEK